MPVRWSVVLLIPAMLATSTLASAQSSERPVAPTARTVIFHPRDLVSLHARLHYTTLIVLPDGEDVVEATCGDKEFWIVNVRGSLVSVKPAKPGGQTNLNVVTASGQLYGFVLAEVSSDKDAEADFTVYIEPDDPMAAASSRAHPQYVLASQLDDFKAQAALARDDARRAIESAKTALENGMTSFRNSYPLGLMFPYQFKADKAPFFVSAIFHDGHRTFIQAHPSELPSLYELKDGRPNLVNFEVHDGTYVIPKVLDSGYLAVGKQRFTFQRVDPR
jgi:type IV secretion system protein VirB9